jgi:glycosyltransferase involved in cell wall biosynthesis
MAAGMPVITIAQPYDDESRIVDQFEAGIQVPQDDVSGIVNAIETWRQDPDLVNQQGANARQAFEEHFTTDDSIDEYYELLTGSRSTNATNT